MKKISSLLSIVLFCLVFTPLPNSSAKAADSTDGTIARYKALVKKNPKSVEAQCSLANSYIEKYISTGKASNSLLFRAKKAISKAEKIDAKSALPQISWARYFMAMDKKETAIKRAQKAATLDPDDTEVKKLLDELGISTSVADNSKGQSKKSDTEKELEISRQKIKLLEEKKRAIEEDQRLIKDKLKKLDKEKKKNYVGEYRNGKRHGKGTYKYTDGGVYIGEWKDDKKQGQGVFTWQNGSEYRGAFKNNKRDGHGTLKYSDGGVYTGEWKDDKRHGQGTYTWTNGQKYEGAFTYNKMTGGWLYSPNGSRLWSYIDSNGKWVYLKSKP